MPLFRFLMIHPLLGDLESDETYEGDTSADAYEEFCEWLLDEHNVDPETPGVRLRCKRVG